MTGRLKIRGESNKTGAGRTISISPRLRSVLAFVRLDPAGNERPGHHFVFGNAVGEPVASSKKAWETAVLKAHGHEPKWTDKKGLARESREALRGIDLHFHDLRHEAGNRWMEQGLALNHIQKVLGHSSVKQTATYLHADTESTCDAMESLWAKPAWQSVANEAPVEQQPDGHDEAAPSPQLTIN